MEAMKSVRIEASLMTKELTILWDTDLGLTETVGIMPERWIKAPTMSHVIKTLCEYLNDICRESFCF